MRFVETKTPEQQSCLMSHRTRHLFIRQQTSVINAIRAHLAEFGIVAAVNLTQPPCRYPSQYLRQRSNRHHATATAGGSVWTTMRRVPSIFARIFCSNSLAASCATSTVSSGGTWQWSET